MLWINAPRILSTAGYLIMGWAVLFAWEDFTALGQPCLTLVALGGICYSVGAVLYAIKKPNLSAEWTFHEIFHVLIWRGPCSTIWPFTSTCFDAEHDQKPASGISGRGLLVLQWAVCCLRGKWQ
mgnify:CR=1 FL=1